MFPSSAIQFAVRLYQWVECLGARSIASSLNTGSLHRMLVAMLATKRNASSHDAGV